MHEYSVALSIADLVLEHCQSRRLEKINLSIGALSGILFESLEMHLQLILEEKGHKDVALVARYEPATFRCACGKDYEVEHFTQGCPACGGYNRQITGGKDCRVESIEVKDD
jgi:hydrogenase nickel incorporation protein HypA/HybF